MTGKGALSQSDDQQASDGQILLDAAIVNAEDKQVSADAAMSVRRTEDHEDEQEKSASNLLEEGSETSGSHDGVLQLAQADISSSSAATRSDGPASVGEELLRQAAPAPATSAPAPTKATGFEAWLKSDWFKSGWGMPVTLGGGALAVLGLAKLSGGGGSGGAKSSPAAASEPSSTSDPDAIPSNMYALTVTPAAGTFNAGAAVRLSVQKRMADGSWQEIASGNTVDASGRMRILVEKSAAGANDMLRLSLSDSNLSENDYNDEVSGPQSLGNVVLQALIGGLSGNTAATVNPLTTLAAKLVGNDFSPAHVNAVNAAVAAAFGLRDSDLTHTPPALLTAPIAGNASPAAINYGLALGIVSGMTQARREAKASDPLQATLDTLATAPLKQAPDGSLSLDLSGLHQMNVTDPGDNAKVIAVGLDAGASRLYAASATNGNIANAQVPYVQVNTGVEKPGAGQTAQSWSKAAVSYANFIDGLTLKIAPADSVQVGDKLVIEFLPLDKYGAPLPDEPTYTFQHIYTKKDADQVSSSRNASGNNSIGSFSVVVPTYEPQVGMAQSSSSDPNVYLFKVDSSQHYDLNAATIGGYQMRASGAVVGLLGAGGSFNVDATPISIQSAPAVLPGTFNGEATPAGSNTIQVRLVLPQGIYWEGDNPKLKLQVSGTAPGASSRVLFAEAELTERNDQGALKKGGNLLNFKAVLSNTADATKGLDGVLSIPRDALEFPLGSTLTDSFGNTLYTNVSGAWKDAAGNAVGNINQALGAVTELVNTGLKVDTTRPATPILEFATQPPAFDSKVVPVAGKINAAPANVAGFNSNDVVTSKIEQEFTVTFADGAVGENDVGAAVKLTATGKSSISGNGSSGVGHSNLQIAITTIVRDGDGKYRAHFDANSFDAKPVEALNTTARKIGSGLLLIEFSVQVVDKAGNTSERALMKSVDSGGRVNNIYLDLTAPSAPSVSLAPASDTGREGTAGTRSDNITSAVAPTIHVSGSLGTFAQVKDSTGLVVASGWLASVAGGNEADLVIAQPLGRATHAFTVTLTDAAGNVGPSTPLTINVLPAQSASSPLPTVAITSTGPHGGYYIVGDTITGQVTFDRKVYLKQGAQGRLSLNLGDVGNHTLNVALLDGYGTDTLTFTHTIVASDANTTTGFTAATLLGVDKLEDEAGSALNPVPATIFTPPATPQLIDTVAPQPPTLELVPDVGTHQGKAGKATALAGVLNVTAEAGAKVALTFTGSTGASKSVTKSVEVSGSGAVAVPLTQAEIDQLGDGTVSVTAVASDRATNPSTPSAPASFTLDATAPTVQARGDKTANVPTNEVLNFTVTFSEALNRDPGVNDFRATQGTVQSVTRVTPGSPNQYVVTVNPQVGISGNGGKVELSLSAASNLADLAGNPVGNTAVLATQAIDTQGPQVISLATEATSAMPTSLPSRPFSWIVTFNEKIGFVNEGNVLGTENFIVSGGNGTARITDVRPFGVDGTQYKVTVDPGTLSGNLNEIKLGLVGFTNINGGKIQDSLGNTTASTPDLNIAGSRVNIDARAPSAQSAAINAANWVGANPHVEHYYHAGDEVMATLGFDEPIAVSGKPTLQLDIGGTARQALFDHVDGNTVFFKYTLTRDDHAPSGIAIAANALGLPAGASITDLAGNMASNATLSAVPANAQFLVDNIAPRLAAAVVTGATPANAGNAHTVGATVTATVSFDDQITIVTTNGKPTLTLDLGGSLRTALYKGKGADGKSLDFTYEVVAGDNASAGVAIPVHALALNGATITDVSGNNALIDNASATAANGSVIVDTQAPTVTDIHIASASRSSASGLYHAGDVLTVTATFSEALATVPDGATLGLVLRVGGNDRTAGYVGQSADRKTLSFTYTLSSTDADGDITIGRNAVKLLGNAALNDVAGNAADLRSVEVGANPSFRLDNATPKISSITSNKANGLYNVDENIDIRATASKALQAGAQVTVTLDNNDTVLLTRDATDPTLLQGSYRVLPGASHGSSDLTVKSITAGASAVDLAGNGLATSLPPPGQNLGDLKAIALNTIIPDAPTKFELAPGSDAGVSGTDGLTSVNQPTFLFSGLRPGAPVEVSAIVGGVKKSFNFIATGAASETFTVDKSLADGVYTEIAVRQFVGGNGSMPLLLSKTPTAGVVTIDTAAPAVAPSVVIFDDLQDRQTPAQVGISAVGTLARDFSTAIITPRFNFKGGQDGETAVLFRDLNGNGIYDDGDRVLGRTTIGSANVANYPDPASTARPPATISGHYVDVSLPLPNGRYSDIYLALQSRSGATGTAVKAASDATGSFQLWVNSTVAATALGSVSTEQGSAATSSNTMDFTVGGGQPGALITIRATGPGGTPITVGSAMLDATTRKFTLDVSSLEGNYSDFQASQSWNGIAGAPLPVLRNGNPLGTVTWDHSVPTVTVIPSIPDKNFVTEGGTVSVKFVFSRPVREFVSADVETTGGTLGAVTMNGSEATANFTANPSVLGSTVSLQVKPGSYSNAAGALGLGSSVLSLPVNHLGRVAITGSTGSNAAPKVGDTLTMLLTDTDARDPATPPTYVWLRSTAGGAPVAISGQTGSTYVVTGADLGSVIRGEVTYRDMSGATRFDPSTVSQNTAVVLSANDPGAVSIISNGAYQGILNPGNTLAATATDGNGLTKGQAVSYQWNRDGVAIAGATGSTYTVLDSDLTHTITATASYTDDQGNADHPVSAGMQVKASNQLGTVTILHVDTSVSATVFRPGQVLKAVVTDGDGVPSAGISYQWSNDHGAIAGATGENYTIAISDVGQSIKVKASYTDLHLYPENRDASPISVSAASDRPLQGTVSLSGLGLVGTVLKAANDIQDPDGIPSSGSGAPMYKWFIRGDNGTETPISEDHLVRGVSNKSQLVLTADLAGADIGVKLVYTSNAGAYTEKASGSPMIVGWPPTFEIDKASHLPLTFTGVAVVAPSSTAQLIRLNGTTQGGDKDLYILDVNGDGQITQVDATTYISKAGAVNFDVNKDLWVKPKDSGVKVTATLLSLNDPAWSVLAADPGNPLGNNGTATGRAGAVTGATTVVPAGDFWTGTPGINANSHMVFTTDPSGPYSRADNSYPGDPGRFHYSVFHLSVIPV